MTSISISHSSPSRKSKPLAFRPIFITSSSTLPHVQGDLQCSRAAVGPPPAAIDAEPSGVENAPMRSVGRRSLSLFGLGFWMLAAAGGQWVELHIAVGHAQHVHPHAEASGIVGLLHHHDSESAGDHEHDASVKVDDPVSPGPRIDFVPSPQLAILPVAV